MEKIKVVCPDCGEVENISIEEARKYESCGDLVFLSERVAKSKKICKKCIKIEEQKDFIKRLPPVILTLKDFIDKEKL